MGDSVNHPDHYNKGKIEVIVFMEDQEKAGLGLHCLNALKYICRSPHRGSEREDLEKAIFYLKRHIEVKIDGKPEDESKDISDVAPFFTPSPKFNWEKTILEQT